MRVLHFNTSDTKGGAARAATRLHQGLLKIGVESSLWTQHQLEHARGVHSSQVTLERGLVPFRSQLDSLPLKMYPQREAKPFSPAWLPNSLQHIVTRFTPDIIHLHWTCGGFIPIRQIGSFTCPVVWTLHDMWPFTGGCHYSDTCTGYTGRCGKCPQLSSKRDHDLSRWIWKRKFASFQRLGGRLHVIAPSRWMKEQAGESSLFQDLDIHVLPNALDCTYFRPAPRAFAKEFFGLDPVKKVILCGDDSRTNPRKGFQTLKKALQHLCTQGKAGDLQLVLFGVNRPVDLTDLDMTARSIGRFHDEASLALLYSTADVFISAATEEALGYTIMEALACGTPAVGFDIGGIADLIDHQENGYLAKPHDVQDLAQGIAWVLENTERQFKLGKHGAEGVLRKYEAGHAASKHVDLYRRLTSPGLN